MRSRARILVVATTVALFSVLSTAALAVNPHFKHGGDPTCAIVYSSDGTSASVRVRPSSPGSATSKSRPT